MSDDNRTHILLRWRPNKQLHKVVVVGGSRPYVNFEDRDGCGTVSVEPYELAKILKSLQRVRR